MVDTEDTPNLDTENSMVDTEVNTEDTPNLETLVENPLEEELPTTEVKENFTEDSNETSVEPVSEESTENKTAPAKERKTVGRKRKDHTTSSLETKDNRSVHGLRSVRAPEHNTKKNTKKSLNTTVVVDTTSDIPAAPVVKHKARKHRKALFPQKVHKDGSKRPHKFRPGTRALFQIRRLQKYTGTLVPRTVIKALIAMVLSEKECNFRIQRSAVNAIHQLFEANAVEIFKSAQNFANHRNRLGVHQKDFEIASHYHSMLALCH